MAHTTRYSYWYPTASEAVPPNEWEHIATQNEKLQLQLANVGIPKAAFPSTSDYNLSIGTGKEVIVSTGFAWIITADGPVLAQNQVAYSVKAAQGLVGVTGAVAVNNWLWAQADGTIIATQTNVPPTGLPLAGTAIVTDTATTAVDSNPVGRVNLATRAFQVAVGGFDPPSIATGGYYSTTVTVAGVRVGDAVLCIPNTVPVAGIFFPPPTVTADNTVRIHVMNFSGGSVDLASQTVTIFVWKY